MPPPPEITDTAVRRRGSALTTAIFVATLEELAESSFPELTFEKIALRAGAGKTSLYRRWPDTVALLRAALIDQATGVDRMVRPDTGSVREDLIAVLGEFARELDRPYGRALRVLLTQRPRHPQLSDEFRLLSVQPRLDAMLAVLRAGMARAEVAPASPVSRVAAVGLQVVVMGHVEFGSVPPAEVEAIVDEIVLPLVAASRPV